MHGCASTAPFGTPERVAGLPEGAVRLRLDPNESVGYYARFLDATSAFNIESAIRSGLHGPFSTIFTAGTNDRSWDLSPSLAADGSVLYFESRDSESPIWKIHQRLWDLKSQSFGAIVVISPLGPKDDNFSDGGPYTTPSGSALYFHSDRPGSGIFRAVEVGTSWVQGGEVPITFPGKIDLMAAYPVVSPDELTLYFAAYEVGRQTDIWRATRATTKASFGEALPLAEINTADANEVPSFISEDGCRLYFDRNSNVPFSWNPPAGNTFVAERALDSE